MELFKEEMETVVASNAAFVSACITFIVRLFCPKHIAVHNSTAHSMNILFIINI